MPKLKFELKILLGLIIILSQISASAPDDTKFAHLAIGNAEETKSRIITLDGNMYFHAGKNKNITFLVSTAASIRFGDTNILDLPNKTEAETIRNDIKRFASRLDYYGKSSTSKQKILGEFAKKLADFKATQTQFTDQIREMNETLKSRGRINRKLKALILRLSGQIDRLLKLMRTDECIQEAPCKNGGTCIDLFGKYQCICPSHYEGKQCDVRVNECEMFAGTPAGCQNNATCTNNENSPGFTCKCPTGFHGHLCQVTITSCDYALDLCGEHGHCTPTEGGYKCLCEWGYKTVGDVNNPFCEDIDECLENPCYPGSSCLNLPGSFKCGNCPAGTLGNGFHCVDFDECVNELTNDCSKDPKVECINTHGSYKCGPCPGGFEGDGYQCTRFSYCRIDHNPCYATAKCIEGVGEKFHCECPGGMVGDGIGLMGCQWANVTLCGESSCENGATCHTVSDSAFECRCPYGYFGERCEQYSVCIQDPTRCGVHGRCVFENGRSTCQCEPGFYGLFCESQEEPCSFHTSNETGTIVFQRWLNNRILKPKICNWHIELFDTRKVLQIQVENVTIPRMFDITSRDCSSSVANFTIFDGPSILSPTLANFCNGDQVLSGSHPFFTSGNAATLRLDSRLQGRNIFINVTWKAVQTRCGGRLVRNNGRIDYFEPSGLIQEQEACVWIVQVPPQYHIQLTVDTLKMISGEFVNCTVNSLEIYDNQFATNRSRVSSLCETQAGPATVVRTSGNYAVIYYRLDKTSQDIKCKKCTFGFTIRYETIDLPEGCGGEIVPDEKGHFEGVIQSPNYDQTYFPNLDCLWVLNATSVFETTISQFDTAADAARKAEANALQLDRKVAIEFVDFDVATTVTKYSSLFVFLPLNQMTSCSGDYVELVELENMYCNHQPPPLLTPIVHAPSLSIRFHSDNTNGGRGFMIKYKTVCQRDFHGLNGSITSPNYPAAAHHSFKCVYRILAQPHQAIRVKFKHIGLHSEYSLCHYNRDWLVDVEDYIELSGGYSSYRAINKRYFCEFFPFVAPGGEIVTSGNRPFQITYSTSGSKLNTGFRFDYEIFDVGCGGVFNEEQKVITSPNYPESYLAHMYCIYHISVRPDASTRKALRLSFDVFDVENVGAKGDDSCDFDSVRLYDWFVDEDNHGDLLGKFCGKSVPPPVLAPNERMVLVFSSDRSVSGAGFSARIDAVDLTLDCDRTFFSPQGVISFNASMFRMTHDIRCDYRIVMPSIHRILLTIHNFSADCSESTLMIRNGGSEDSPGFPSLYQDSKLCGVFTTKRLQSQGNRLFLRFQSQNTATAFFNVSYEPYEQGCGGHVRGYEGAIAAPQYPQQDSRTLTCEWQISVAAGNKVRLTFVDIDNLDSDDYFGGCGVHTRNLISVLDGPTSGISGGGDDVLRRYCKRDNTSTPILSRRGNQLTVRYSQYGGSRHGAIYGFMAQFKTECTNIVLSEPYGTLQSPGYPDPIYNTFTSVHCKWTIITAEGSRVRLLFHRFRIQQDRKEKVLSTIPVCTNSALTIQSPNVMLPEILKSSAYQLGGSRAWLVNDSIPHSLIDNHGRLCGESGASFHMIALSNTLEIDYYISAGISNSQFWMTWITDGCGSTIYINNTQLRVNTNTDFVPPEISDARRCSWKIIAPVGYQILVNISELYTADQPSADASLENEGLEFYSALSNVSGAPIKSFKGALRNVSFTSFTNELFVQFFSHASTLERQFHADFGRDGIVLDAQVIFIQIPSKEASGGALIKLEVGTTVQIHSPNYPDAPPMGTHAIWQFEAPTGFSVVYRIRRYVNRNNWVRTSSNAAESCSAGQVYANGGISIFYGSYKRIPPSLYRVQNMMMSICETIESTRVITTQHNVSGIIFRASRHEPVMRSGESTAQAGPIGFIMDVNCECGGTLYATSERRSMIVTRRQEVTANCQWDILLGEQSRERSAGKRQERPAVSAEYDDYGDIVTPNADSSNNDDGEGQRIYLRIECLDTLDLNSPTEFEPFCGDVSMGNVTSTTFDQMLSDPIKPNYYETSCDTRMRLAARNLENSTEFLVSYDTESSFCGGELIRESGRIVLAPQAATSPPRLECEWHVSNVAGSRVKVLFRLLNFLETELCEESYLELREFNSTGPLIGRYCKSMMFEQIEKESIWIRLRYVFKRDETEETKQNEASESASDVGRKPFIKIEYEKLYGGETISPIIESPPILSTGALGFKKWDVSGKMRWIIRGDVDKYLRIELLEYSFLNSLMIYPDECETSGCNELRDVRVVDVRTEIADGNRVFLLKSSVATIVSDRYSRFRMQWSELSRAAFFLSGRDSSTASSNDASLSDSTKQPGFSCGSELHADFTPKILRSPTNSFGHYKNNERCKWTIYRQPFTSVAINVTSLEMEEHTECRYDYLALISEAYETDASISAGNIPEYLRLCRKDQLDSRLSYTYDAETYVYMITDRSRVFAGFTLEYYLTCRTFEYIPAKRGVLDAILTSPGYPHVYRSNESCAWGTLLESNRDVAVQSLEMDLEPRNIAGVCDVDYLEVSDKSFGFVGDDNSQRFCGNERVDAVLKSGRIFIRFHTSERTPQRRGFKLHIFEVLFDCSASDLTVDEFTPIRVLSSPKFPHMSPNSLDCSWTLSAPSGRRLKFTVDPISFHLQTSSDELCEDDYLEVRDGASELSPLVGRYCGVNPPSSIVSTGEHLHIRYVTDSITQSIGWNATYQLERCGGVISLRAGHNGTISSPNFPDLYPEDSECEWTIRAAAGHFVEAFVDFIFVAPIRNCTEEFLEIRDINSTGPYLQRPICVKDAAMAAGYRSSHNTLFVRFRGNSTFGRSNRHRFCQFQKCGFKMHFTSTKYACGGKVTEDSGVVYPPGYPNHIIPHVSCQWDFRTDLQHRYVLELEFLDSKHEFYTEAARRLIESDTFCFMNLEVWNGGISNRYVQYPAYHRFCRNATVFVSSADQATLLYDDGGYGYAGAFYGAPAIQDVATYEQGNRSHYYRPFHVRYTKVDRDYDRDSCVYDVNSAQVIEIKDLRHDFRMMWNLDIRTRFTKSFCHIRINQPAANSTVRLDFTKFRAGRYGSKFCGITENRVIVTDETASPYPIERALCNGSLAGSDNISLTYINPRLDVYVLNNPITLMSSMDATVSFTLSVTYNSCGGVISEDEDGMTGEITSPRFGFGNYSVDTDCVWLLHAPEDKVISLEILSMDIEYHIECSNDYLEISEGHDRLAIIHRYCNEKDTEYEVAERFRRIRTNGRLLTLVFHSDKSVTREGFRIAYEFVDPVDGGCGFHSHAKSGIVHSPNYPADYPNSASCLWDLSVPIGYHVRLTFESVDIAMSRDCHSDYLLVSQEHQSRAMAPVGSYYFYFDHEEILRRVCGTDMPSPIESESNRLRLNFTTDAQMTARGFKARWEAVCGTVFKMNHGVITSPNYPHFYPNENLVCEYLINPETNGAPQIVTLKVWDADLDNTHSIIEGIPSPMDKSSKYRDCLSDYVEVRDVIRNTVQATLCGSTSAATSEQSMPPAISIRGPIAIRFIANVSAFHEQHIKHHRGFKISYALADCGGEVNLAEARSRMSTVITSPGFPLPYHHNLDCTWSITAPADRIISYKFTDLDLEVSSECSFDYVEIFDGPQMPESRSGVQRVCGQMVPDGQQVTRTNYLLVRFVTDMTSQSGGFRLVITATLGPQSGCGGELEATADWKTLIPPLNPAAANKYYADLRCEWKIRTRDPKKVIELRFTQLDMEVKREQQAASTAAAVAAAIAAALGVTTTTVAPVVEALPSNWHTDTGATNASAIVDSCYDFVAVYDGPKSTSPFLMGPSCTPPEDMNMPISFVSSYDTVSVYFESDSYDEFRGFSMDYRAEDSDCTGSYLASAESRTLRHESDRALTRKNQRHKRCRYYIYSDTKQPVEITFTAFSYPSRSSDCSEEYLELRDVGAVAECNHPACAQRQGDVTNAQLRACGAVMPPRFVSRTSIVQLTSSVIMQSEFSAVFQIRYQTLSDCNRTIDLIDEMVTGRLTSPNYPNSYNHNDTCTTYLIAPRDRRILLVFRNFRMEPSRQRISNFRTFERPWYYRNSGIFGEVDSSIINGVPSNVFQCAYDALTIYYNSSNPVQNLTLCGFVMPDSILSTQNKMTLSLLTDDSMAYEGYEAFYYTVKLDSVTADGVSEKTVYELGTIRETVGALTHAPCPENDTLAYSSDSILRAMIFPPLGMECSLEFRHYEMGAIAGQCGDYLTLTRMPVDTSAQSTPSFREGAHARLPCEMEAGGKFPLPAGNAVLVAFHTDNDPLNDGGGFRLEWTCEPVKTIQF